MAHPRDVPGGDRYTPPSPAPAAHRYSQLTAREDVAHIRRISLVIRRGGDVVSAETLLNIAERLERVFDLAGLPPEPVKQLAPVAFTLAPSDDFPLGQACDLSADGTCESCQ